MSFADLVFLGCVALLFVALDAKSMSRDFDRKINWPAQGRASGRPGTPWDALKLLFLSILFYTTNRLRRKP